MFLPFFRDSMFGSWYTQGYTQGVSLKFLNEKQVEAECKEDPEGLALRLAGKGAVSAALEVAESAELSIDLRRELQGRQLVKLLTTDPLNGGGPAEASRFLSSLQDSADALPVVMGAMQLLPDLRSKQLLVTTFFHGVTRSYLLLDLEKCLFHHLCRSISF